MCEMLELLFTEKWAHTFGGWGVGEVDALILTIPPAVVGKGTCEMLGLLFLKSRYTRCGGWGLGMWMCAFS
jgi:hypothetical protein